VVAICVVFVAAAAVGAVGVPVNAGDAASIFAVLRFEKFVSTYAIVKGAPLTLRSVMLAMPLLL
jgi:hypothetical protein